MPEAGAGRNEHLWDTASDMTMPLVLTRGMQPDSVLATRTSTGSLPLPSPAWRNRAKFSKVAPPKLAALIGQFDFEC